MTSMLRVALASVAVVILAWAIGHEGAGRAGDVPASVAASQPAEKLILGFEKAEIEHKKQGKTCWTVLENVEGGVDHWAPFEFGEVDRTWTWHCRSGDATEGKLSLLARTGTGAAFREFRATPITERYYPTLRTNSDAAVLLNTYTVAELTGVSPAINPNPAGQMAYVSNGAGGRPFAVSTGTLWKYADGTSV